MASVDPEARDEDWYRARLPPFDTLVELLGDDPAATLLAAIRSRAVANATMAVVDDPAAAALVSVASGAVRRLADSNGRADLTAEELAALDVVVLIVARPALFVRDGQLLSPPPNWPRLETERALVEPNLAGIGLVSCAEVGIGSAVLVGACHALTNNHVVCQLLGLELGAWRAAGFAAELSRRCGEWTPQNRPRVDFAREFGSGRGRIAEVVDIAAHPREDLAVLVLAEPVANVRPLPLHATAPRALEDHDIYAIGYPICDGPGTTPLVILERLFGRGETLSTKRVSPGYLKGRESLGLRHDASTLNGSSGSAIVDFDSHEVVALHYRGRYRDKINHAVPLWELLDDPLLVDHHIRPP